MPRVGVAFRDARLLIILLSPPLSCHFSRCRRRLSCRRACRQAASPSLPRHLYPPLLHLALVQWSSSASMRTPSTLLTQNPLLMAVMASGVRRVLPSERPTPVRDLIFEWSGCETIVLHESALIVYLGTCCCDILVIGSHHWSQTYILLCYVFV